MERLPYRVRQLSSALVARQRRFDEAPARRVLPPALWSLFVQLSPEDRRHALIVLAALEAAGSDSLPPAAGPGQAANPTGPPAERVDAHAGPAPRDSELPLLQAALLHDIGKAGAGITLIHRVLRVLLARPAPAIWRWLTASPTDWRRPFWVLANHAARGAVWVQSSGGSPELVALIGQHDAPAPAQWAGTPLAAWHAALQRVDGRS